MSMEGVETIFDQIEDKLQADLPDKIDAINALYGDSVVIEAPPATSYHRMLDPKDQAEIDAIVYPAVVLRPEPENVVGDADLSNGYEVDVPIEVAVMVGYDSSDRQQIQLLRYMRAVKEILGQLGAIAYGGCRYEGGGFARTYTTDSGVVRDVAMIFTVSTSQRAE